MVIRGNRLDFEALRQACRKPEPFASGEPRFWDDEHISQQLLAAHLDPETDLASRRPGMIDATVQWLLEYLHLRPGDRVLDLGCGPGLYCERFSRAGLDVTGIDFSQRSIEFARAEAGGNGLAVDYQYGNYLDVPFPHRLRAIFMIYGDFCVLSNRQRDGLLGKIAASLDNGGRFVFDVSARKHRQEAGARNQWAFFESGFWKPVPHLVLTQGFDYPSEGVFLDQFVVITEDGAVSVYRNWFHDYSLETITAALAARGFAVEAGWSDLAGTPYDPSGGWIGVAARVVERCT